MIRVKPLGAIVSLASLTIIVALLACNQSPKVNAMARRNEESRVTSPNGQLDAIIIRQDAGGAPGGWEWNIYIAAKGKSISDSSQPILYAGTFAGQKLAWIQDHLLEIQYDIADIHSFRNLWSLSEVQNVGSVGERNYMVEIRLAPTSHDFSLLTSEGTFKPKN